MQDIRLAIRSLTASPIVTSIAVLSLALGIGANTAIFSLVNALMLRPLPVAAPERLAVLSGGIPTFPWVPPLPGYTDSIWTAIRDRAAEFDGFAAWFPQRLDLARSGEIQPVDTLFVSEQYFQSLGVGAFLGRVFQRDDEPSAVLSHSFWQQHFEGRADVLGQQLLVEHVPFTIVGVAPSGFLGTEVGRTFDVALPMKAVVPMGRSSLLNAMITRILIRLKPHQSIEAATARLRALQPEIRRVALPGAGANPGFDTPFTLAPATNGTSALRERYRRPMLIVFAVVVLVLLVACANLANLLMARATTRRHEFGVRCALGATRGQLIRLLFVESVLLAGSSALLGLAFARWGAPIVVSQFSTPFVHVTLDTAPDLRVLAFTIGASALTVLLFGIAPAFSASRVDPIDALRLTVRTAAGEPSRRMAAILVAGQVMLSIVVVSVAALLAHSFVNVMRLPLGFDADRVLLVTVSTLHSDVPPARRFTVLSEIVEAIRVIPNVKGAGASTLTPASGVAVISFVSGSAAEHLSESERVVTTNMITSGWIATYGMSLHAGRDLEAADMTNGRLAMLVNEAFAHRFLREGRAVGETIPFQDGSSRTVVGVVSDAIYNSAKEAIPPTIYLPLGVTPPTMTVSVHVGVGRSTDVIPAIRNAIGRIDRDAAFSFRTLADQVHSATAQDRLVALLAIAFSMLALALAALGIYGVTAYAVARRRAEIGIRMALGAQSADIVTMVLARVWIVLGAGVTIGVPVSFWAATAVRSLLYGLEPHDPATLAGASAVLVAVGTLAGWLPAWRASQIDPAEVLRES